MMVLQVLAVSLWIPELKKKLRLRVLAGSEVEETLIRKSPALSRKLVFGSYCAVTTCFVFFSFQRQRTTLNRKLPSWIQVGKPKLHSVCPPPTTTTICSKWFVWILNSSDVCLPQFWLSSNYKMSWSPCRTSYSSQTTRRGSQVRMFSCH